MRLRRGSRTEAGFTLPDVLVGITLTMIVTSLMVAGAMAVHRAQRFSQTDSDNLGSLRVALGRFEKEARQSRKVYDGSNATKIKLWVDRDRDYQQDFVEQIYWEIVDLDGAGPLTSAQLTRTTAADITGGVLPVIVARNLVYQDTFFYNNDSGLVDTSTLVTLILTAEQPGSRAPGRTVRTAVRMRNASTSGTSTGEVLDGGIEDDPEGHIDVDLEDQLDGT
jgi:type II secretory pathway pseudopilin PulG